MSELNTRQWNLYNILKERGTEWTTQLDLALAIKEYDYDGAVEPIELFHDSQARLMITNDIRAINESAVIQKIIISSNKGVKIATEEEFERYIKSEFASVLRKLQRVKKKAKKGGMNGQMRVVFGRERDTIEAFINETFND